MGGELNSAVCLVPPAHLSLFPTTGVSVGGQLETSGQISECTGEKECCLEAKEDMKRLRVKQQLPENHLGGEGAPSSCLGSAGFRKVMLQHGSSPRGRILSEGMRACKHAALLHGLR